MNIKKQTLIACLLLIMLAGCGGGGSSSGGGSSGGVTYLGTETLNIRARGTSFTQSETLGLEVNINGDAVVVTDSDGVRYNGTIDAGGNFNATGIALSGDIGDGITCEPLRLNYRGNLSGNTVTGSVSGFAKCTLNGVDVVLDSSGNFSANI